MSDAITNAAFNRLSRTALHNPSSSVRKAALLDIRKLDHPQVADVLQQVIDGDSDAEVRDLAQNLLRKYEINTLLEAGRLDDTPEAFPVSEDLMDDFTFDEHEKDEVADWQYESSTQETVTTRDWTCCFCDTVNPAKLHECASCGADREPSTAPANLYPDDLFLLYKGNQKFITEQRRYPVSSSHMSYGCLTVFLIPFIFVGIFVMLFAANEWNRYNLLTTSGVTVSGEYTGSRIDNDDDGTTYYVSYKFNSGDNTYTNEHSVDYEIYRLSERGASVDVLYAPFDPSISRIAGTNSIETPLFLTIFSLLWNLLLGIFIFSSVHQFLRDRTLAREGVLVRGEILEIDSYTGSKGRLYIEVQYRFTPPNHQAITKTEEGHRSDLIQKPLPTPGTPMIVLYRNPDHYRML